MANKKRVLDCDAMHYASGLRNSDGFSKHSLAEEEEPGKPLPVILNGTLSLSHSIPYR